MGLEAAGDTERDQRAGYACLLVRGNRLALVASPHSAKASKVYAKAVKPVIPSRRPSHLPKASVVSPLGYIALWAGLYVVGSLVFLAQISGLDDHIHAATKFTAVAFTFCTATGVYLLDRVKLRDAWLDPADAHAHPKRFNFVSSHARPLRIAMLVLLAVAAGLGWMLMRWGVLIPPLAAMGVFVYAGRPRDERPRPKDVMLLKNFYVALGITGFAVLISLAAIRPRADLEVLAALARRHVLLLALAAAHLMVRVFADAVLCDLDDEDADRRFGTETLPIHLGRNKAWNTALGIRLAAALILAAIPVLPLGPRLAWAGVTVVSSLTLRFAAPRRLRDWVDARFAIEAAVVSLVLCLA